jgi:hypothetical protein
MLSASPATMFVLGGVVWAAAIFLALADDTRGALRRR